MMAAIGLGPVPAEALTIPDTKWLYMVLLSPSKTRLRLSVLEVKTPTSPWIKLTASNGVWATKSGFRSDLVEINTGDPGDDFWRSSSVEIPSVSFQFNSPVELNQVRVNTPDAESGHLYRLLVVNSKRRIVHQMRLTTSSNTLSYQPLASEDVPDIAQYGFYWYAGFWTWSEAEQHCRDQGLMIGEPRTSELQNDVVAATAGKGAPLWFGVVKGDGACTSCSNANTWSWFSDGLPVTMGYQNWTSGEPMSQPTYVRGFVQGQISSSGEPASWSTAKAASFQLTVLCQRPTLTPTATTLTATTTATTKRSPGIRISDGLSYALVNGTREPLHGPDYRFQAFDNWASGSIVKSVTNFFGGTFIGDDLWMVPATNGKSPVKVNKHTGVMTEYSAFPLAWSSLGGNACFVGAVFDGRSLWMIPGHSNQVVKVDPSSGVMTGYEVSGPLIKYWGGTYDGQGSIWMTPYGVKKVSRVTTDSGALTAFDDWPTGFTKQAGSLCGATFDGRYHWMFPETGTWVVGLDTEEPSNTMRGFNAATWTAVALGPGANKFTSGIHTVGTTLYLIPELADSIVRLDTATGAATGHKNWPPAFNPTPGTTYMFRGAIFDGHYLWMGLRGSASRFALRFDTYTSAITTVGGIPAAFSGACLGMSFDPDTNSVWWIPGDANMVVRMTSTTFTPTEFTPTGGGNPVVAASRTDTGLTVTASVRKTLSSSASHTATEQASPSHGVRTATREDIPNFFVVPSALELGPKPTVMPKGKALCEAQGGVLASITSQEDQKFVSKLLQQEHARLHGISPSPHTRVLTSGFVYSPPEARSVTAWWSLVSRSRESRDVPLYSTGASCIDYCNFKVGRGGGVALTQHDVLTVGATRSDFGFWKLEGSAGYGTKAEAMSSGVLCQRLPTLTETLLPTPTRQVVTPTRQVVTPTRQVVTPTRHVVTPTLLPVPESTNAPPPPNTTIVPATTTAVPPTVTPCPPQPEASGVETLSVSEKNALHGMVVTFTVTWPLAPRLAQLQPSPDRRKEPAQLGGDHVPSREVELTFPVAQNPEGFKSLGGALLAGGAGGNATSSNAVNLTLVNHTTSSVSAPLYASSTFQLSLPPLPGYSTDEDEQVDVWLAPVYFEQHVQCPATSAVRIARINVIDIPDAVAVAVATATAVVTATAATSSVAAGGAAAAGDAQSLAIIALMSCAQPMEKKMTKNTRLLSPLALDDTYSGMISGNLLLLAIVAAVQVLLLCLFKYVIKIKDPNHDASVEGGAPAKKVRRPHLEASELVRFPALLLITAMLTLPGTGAAALQLMGEIDSIPAMDVFWGVLGAVTSLGLPVVLHIIRWRHVTAEFGHYQFVPGTIWHKMRYILPRGRWYPRIIRKCYGPTFSSVGRPESVWATLGIWGPLSVLFLSMFRPSTAGGCVAQFSILAAIQMLLALIYVAVRPLRSMVANILSALSSFCLGIVFSASATLADDPKSPKARWFALSAVQVQLALTLLRTVYMVSMVVLERFKLKHLDYEVQFSVTGSRVSRKSANNVLGGSDDEGGEELGALLDIPLVASPPIVAVAPVTNIVDSDKENGAQETHGLHSPLAPIQTAFSPTDEEVDQSFDMLDDPGDLPDPTTETKTDSKTNFASGISWKPTAGAFAGMDHSYLEDLLNAAADDGAEDVDGEDDEDWGQPGFSLLNTMGNEVDQGFDMLKTKTKKKPPKASPPPPAEPRPPTEAERLACL